VHHTPNQLSGGQQQRVAIARALVTDPPLLLADEPTGNLDTRTSLEVLALLQELNKKDGITIVLVTHEHDIAACAARVVTFRDGRIVTDVVQDKPLDAAQALRELPPPQEGSALATEDEDNDPVLAARMRRGGPVPFAVYSWMLVGALLGALTGILYNAAVLSQRVVWVPIIFAAIGESFLAARFGRRKLGRPLTNDQRTRVAIAYTIGTTAIAAPFLFWKMPYALTLKLEGVSAGGVVLTVAVFLLALGALGLLRYLLMSLFSPRK
jgi:hypothetical protein